MATVATVNVTQPEPDPPSTIHSSHDQLIILVTCRTRSCAAITVHRYSTVSYSYCIYILHCTVLQYNTVLYRTVTFFGFVQYC